MRFCERLHIFHCYDDENGRKRRIKIKEEEMKKEKEGKVQEDSEKDVSSRR